MAGPATSADLRISLPWVAAVTISTLLGLGLVRIAAVKAIDGGSLNSAVPLFFLGVALIFTPNAMRVLMRKTARTERFALVMLLGIAFYLVKVLQETNAFIYTDEFIHLRNTQDILSSGHLFQYNPLLPTASYYPGLASITASMVNLTGLSTFICGLIIIGVARVVISASFFFVAEQVTGSARGASAASLLYAANSMFLLWSAQFAYEDLALPLAAFTVWWLTRTRGTSGRIAAQAVTVVAIVAVTVTHHVSAFALCGILALLYLAERIFGYAPATRRYLGIFAAVTGAMAAFWLFLVAKPAAPYLFGQNLGPAAQGIISTLTGHGGGRVLYGAGTSEAPPKWYVYVGFVGLLIIIIALVPAVIRAWHIVRSSGIGLAARHKAPVAVAAIIAASLPLTLLPRLTTAGDAISGRTSELIFTGIGCTIGLLWVEAGSSASPGLHRIKSLAPFAGLRALLAALLLLLVLVSQISIGYSFFSVLPASTGGFPIYVQPSMISVADWADKHLGPDQVFATDSVNQLALAAYGDEDPVPATYVWPIFYDSAMDSVAVDAIKKYDIHYVLIDWVMTKEKPLTPGVYYYSSLEPISKINGGPLPKAYFSKFSGYTCSHMVYQSGSIQIYDVSQIANGSCVPHHIDGTASQKSQGKKPASKDAQQ